jgi:hypothetical protein
LHSLVHDRSYANVRPGAEGMEDFAPRGATRQAKSADELMRDYYS